MVGRWYNSNPLCYSFKKNSAPEEIKLISKSVAVDSNSRDKVCLFIPGELPRLNPVFLSEYRCRRLAHVEYRKSVNADVMLQLINMCVLLRD